jgi:hypothetical protein
MFELSRTFPRIVGVGADWRFGDNQAGAWREVIHNLATRTKSHSAFR